MHCKLPVMRTYAYPSEMRLEKLSCYALDCSPGHGPWPYTIAGFYSRTLASNPIDPEVRLALIIILTAAVLKNRHNAEIVDKLKTIQVELLTANTADQVISLGDRAAAACGLNL